MAGITSASFEGEIIRNNSSGTVTIRLSVPLLGVAEVTLPTAPSHVERAENPDGVSLASRRG